MHAFRDIFLRDDLNRLAGVYFKIEIPNVDNAMIRHTLRLFDNSPIRKQVVKFCELNSIDEEACQYVIESIGDYFRNDIPRFG